MPFSGLQAPARWQESGAAHVTGAPAVQTPRWQVSLWVQAFLSSQGAPSALAGFEHVPLVGSQVPGSWHASLAAQATGFAPEQTPAWQVSLWVQALLSLQAAPSGFDGLLQPVTGSHTPARWQVSSAAQVTGAPPAQ